jgi:apolipoprotein N-acyltransferase
VSLPTAVFFGIASGVAFVTLTAQLAAPYAKRQLILARRLRRWLEVPQSLLDIVILGFVAVVLALVWIATALDPAQPTAARVIGALHTVLVAGWTGYLALNVGPSRGNAGKARR